MRFFKTSAAPCVAVRRILAASLLGTCCLQFLPLTLAIAPGAVQAEDHAEAETPPPGSAERKAILDALRSELKALHQLEVIFVVTHLKVLHNWAFTHAFPQSADGASKYEDVSALMQNQGGEWKVVDLIPADLEDLKKTYPSAPPAIFSGF